jgi:hypothetical protein
MILLERLVRICATSLVAGAILLMPLISVRAQEYIFDIAKRNRRILSAWEWIVPSTYSRHEWIKHLNGTTFPVDRLVVGGKAFYLGAVCKPHDCADNNVVFLLSVDGSEAYGMLRSSALNVKDAFFGFPDGDKQGLLKRFMNDRS